MIREKEEPMIYVTLLLLLKFMMIITGGSRTVEKNKKH